MRLFDAMRFLPSEQLIVYDELRSIIIDQDLVVLVAIDQRRPMLIETFAVYKFLFRNCLH